ncbi:hypothetical protein V8E51_011981 [Hyaloscypha variabilis]
MDQINPTTSAPPPSYTREELIRLRKQLEVLRQHLKDAIETTNQQQAVLDRIRTQYESSEPSNPEFVESQKSKELHEAFAMEECTSEESAKQQEGAVNQIQDIAESIDELISQNGEQGQSSEADFDASQIEEQNFADNVPEPEESTSNEESSIILQFQPNQTQQHREKIRFEGLAGAQIFPALDTNLNAPESAALEPELLNATDETQDQVPVSLLSPKEQNDINMLFEESDEAVSQTSVKRSPLQNRSADADGQLQGANTLVSQHGYDSVDEDMVYGDENSEDLIDWSLDDEDLDLSSTPIVPAHSNDTEASVLPHHSPVAPTTQSGLAPAESQSDITNQHHDEALNQPWDDLARPLPSRTFPTASLDSLRILFMPHEDDLGQEYRDKLDALEMFAQQEYGMTLINWEEANNMQEKIEQLEPVLASLEETRGELEQSRRDLATRTGERNGARQRIAILEDEVKERDMKEFQLREELRLEREEDPLADKLFVELSELRKQLEEAEEKAKSLPELQKVCEEVDGKRAVAEQKLVVMQQQLVDAEATMKETRERLADANEQQSVAERDKVVMQQRLTDAATTVRELQEILVDVGRSADQEKAHNTELQSKLSEANDQLASLKEIVSAKDAEILKINAQIALQADVTQLTAQLAIARQEFGEANVSEQDNETINAQQAEIEDLKSQLTAAKECQEELKRLTAERLACEQEVSNLLSQLQDATTALALARTATRNAVAAAEQTRDELCESHDALVAANDIAQQLRRVSAENIRELLDVRQERDTALQDVARLTRDFELLDREMERAFRGVEGEWDNALSEMERLNRELDVALQEASNLRREVDRLEEGMGVLGREAEELGRENVVLTGRYVEAERRAGEYGRQVLDYEKRAEDLQRLVEELNDNAVSMKEEVSPRSPISPISPNAGEEPDSPGLFVDSKPKPRYPKKKQEVEPAKEERKDSESVIPPERRGTRKTRNPAPVYVDPPSPPDSPTVPRKRGLKRRRGQGEKDQAPKRKRK